MRRRWLAVLLAGSLAGVLACSTTTTSYVDEPIPDEQDAGFDSRPSAESGLGELTFRPETSFSGFDGVHTFTVPLAVYDAADDLKVTATDPTAVTIVPTKLKNPTRNDGTSDNGQYFLVTVKKAGTLTLQATSQGRTAQSTITVASYPSVRWEAGETRYTGGAPPCTKCHVDGDAIDHSPAALATATDEKIGAVITTGISTAGFPIKVDGVPGHQWQVTAAEREGLITYLRALAPQGFR